VQVFFQRGAGTLYRMPLRRVFKLNRSLSLAASARWRSLMRPLKLAPASGPDYVSTPRQGLQSHPISGRSASSAICWPAPEFHPEPGWLAGWLAGCDRGPLRSGDPGNPEETAATTFLFVLCLMDPLPLEHRPGFFLLLGAHPKSSPRLLECSRGPHCTQQSVNV